MYLNLYAVFAESLIFKKLQVQAQLKTISLNRLFVSFASIWAEKVL